MIMNDLPRSKSLGLEGGCQEGSTVCPVGEPLLDSLALLPNSAEFGAKFPRPDSGHILTLMNPHAPWRWLHASFPSKFLLV